MTREVFISSEEQMLSLGFRIASNLHESAFIALYGNLGAGKSVLVRGAAHYFGIDCLTSPTFTIVQEYPADIPFFHFDAYRVADEDELMAIGFNDYMNRKGIIFMEWADLVPGLLPRERLDITITGSGMDTRTVRLTSYGKTFDELLEKL